MTREEVIDRYGPIEDGKWAKEGEWCVLFDVPEEISKTLINSFTGEPAKTIYCNKDSVQALSRAFQSIIEKGLASKLKTFDGCYHIRWIRGYPGLLSAHSWAMAFDFNASTNRLGDTNGDMDEEVVKCFTEAGFIWGGTFSRVDKMHLTLLGF